MAKPGPSTQAARKVNPPTFWSGTLVVNDNLEHSFFDVKIRPHPTDSRLISLYTCDLPPLAVFPTDQIHFTLALESALTSTPVRHRAAEAELLGEQMRKQGALQSIRVERLRESHKISTPLPDGFAYYQLTTSTAEWTFLSPLPAAAVAAVTPPSIAASSENLDQDSPKRSSDVHEGGSSSPDTSMKLKPKLSEKRRSKSDPKSKPSKKSDDKPKVRFITFTKPTKDDIARKAAAAEEKSRVYFLFSISFFVSSSVLRFHTVFDEANK